MIRVFAGLHTSTHNLNKLLRYTRLFSMEPSAVFPRNTPEEMHLFDLLFKGYSDARYRQRSEEHTSELQSLMRISYAVFCLKKKITYTQSANECNIAEATSQAS